eukprot:5542334-Pleurochrysis_carterae.AAC.2
MKRPPEKRICPRTEASGSLSASSSSSSAVIHSVPCSCSVFVRHLRTRRARTINTSAIDEEAREKGVTCKQKNLDRLKMHRRKLRRGATSGLAPIRSPPSYLSVPRTQTDGGHGHGNGVSVGAATLKRARGPLPTLLVGSKERGDIGTCSMTQDSKDTD